MTDTPETTKRFDDCLLRFQARDALVTDEFETLIPPYLSNLSRRIAPQLPTDLHQEVVQQTCLNLLGNSRMKFNPKRGSAKMFLVLAVRNALRQVRADYCPPGQPTRRSNRNSEATEQPSHRCISIEELDEEVGSDASELEIIARCDADSLLKLAPEEVVIALERIHYWGDTITEVADDLKVSRYKLSRQIAAYYSQVHLIVDNVIVADQFAC